MSQLPRSAAGAVATIDRSYSRKNQELLNSKQWLYVQNRHNLTPREREIAELICRGFENEKIAESLRVKPGTVKTHIRNIYRKVRVRSKISMLLRFVGEARQLH